LSSGQLPTRDTPMPLIAFRPDPNRRVTRFECDQSHYGCPVEALQEALLRESRLLQEKEALLAQQEILRSESDHRLLNGLQMVVSLLSLQGRSSTNLDVGRQLSIAANRVATIERIHRRLHFNDGAKTVAFKGYLDDFCRDFKGVIAFDNDAPNHILVEGIDVLLPTTTAIPLGFIVNELITNAVKYGRGQIVVRLQAGPANGYILSVSNEGPPLPAEYDPAASKGLGMRIIQSFVRQIGGTFYFDRGESSLGPCFAVQFS
jgi:two-component sensor histidine kinase